MTIGKLAGIPFVIHPTFWIIVAVVAFTGGVSGVALVFAVFACVVLHELGHALAARRYGIRTRSITLYPIGGIASLERIPERPREELVVALAGPAVNIVIAAALGALILVVDSAFLARLAMINLFLVAFNMLPAFPLDGGRVLRAILAYRLAYVRATTIAATVGKVMVVPFVLAAFVWNPLLLLIAAFVWFGGSAEAAAVKAREALDDARVMQASMADFFVLEPGDRLSHAVELTLNSPQKDFPVMRGDTIIGSLSQAELIEAVAERGAEGHVADVMQPSPPAIESDELLAEAVELMRSKGVPFLPVIEGGSAIGIVTLDNVEEFMKLRLAFGGRAPIRVQHTAFGAEPALQN